MATTEHRNLSANWEGEKTPWRPRYGTSLAGAYMLGRNASSSARNRANPALPATIQGAPTYHDGYVDFLGLDTNQSRLVSQHLETVAFTWIIAFKVPATIVTGDYPCLISSSGGKSQAVPARSVSGSRIVMTGVDGALQASVAGWDPTAASGAGAISNTVASMSAANGAPAPGTWAILSLRADGAKVQLDNWTVRSHIETALAANVVRDPGNQPIVLGDNAIAQTTYDGPCSPAQWLNYEASLSDANLAIAVGQVRARCAGWGISL